MGKMKMVAEGETLILADGNKIKSLEELLVWRKNLSIYMLYRVTI